MTCSQATIWAGRKVDRCDNLLRPCGVIQRMKQSGTETWGHSGFRATILCCVLMFLGQIFTDEGIGVYICASKGMDFKAGIDCRGHLHAVCMWLPYYVPLTQDYTATKNSQ